MDWLTNWDDLIHGTAVFSAAVPFVLGLLAAWKLPMRYWWAGVVLAVVPSFCWLFGIPNFPPTSSEDVAVLGLILAATILLSPPMHWSMRPLIACLLFGVVAWGIYPAWLQEDGGFLRKFLVCGGLAASVALLAAVAEWLHAAKNEAKRWVSLSVFIPPSIALAVLLQLGGSARFGQAMGALAAALGAICLGIVVLNSKSRPRLVASLWGMLFMLVAWSGWLFAELRYGLAALLLLAPMAGMLVNRLPLPRQHAFFEHLWDGLASGLVSGIVAGIAISQYLTEMSEFEGY